MCIEPESFEKTKAIINGFGIEMTELNEANLRLSVTNTDLQIAFMNCFMRLRNA